MEASQRYRSPELPLADMCVHRSVEATKSQRLPRVCPLAPRQAFAGGRPYRKMHAAAQVIANQLIVLSSPSEKPNSPGDSKCLVVLSAGVSI